MTMQIGNGKFEHTFGIEEHTGGKVVYFVYPSIENEVDPGGVFLADKTFAQILDYVWNKRNYVVHFRLVVDGSELHKGIIEPKSTDFLSSMRERLGLFFEKCIEYDKCRKHRELRWDQEGNDSLIGLAEKYGLLPSDNKEGWTKP